MTLQLTTMQKIDEKIKAINEGEQKTTNGIFYLLAIQTGIIKQSRLYRSIKWCQSTLCCQTIFCDCGNLTT